MVVRSLLDLLSGVFENIDWGGDISFLQIEMDFIEFFFVTERLDALTSHEEGKYVDILNLRAFIEQVQNLPHVLIELRRFQIDNFREKQA